MRIVNNIKYSVKNVSPLGVALGLVYLSVATVTLKIGVQSVAYGLGFRGKVTVYR